jgi:hypothetical protein
MAENEDVGNPTVIDSAVLSLPLLLSLDRLEEMVGRTLKPQQRGPKPKQHGN